MMFLFKVPSNHGSSKALSDLLKVTATADEAPGGLGLTFIFCIQANPISVTTLPKTNTSKDTTSFIVSPAVLGIFPGSLVFRTLPRFGNSEH